MSGVIKHYGKWKDAGGSWVYFSSMNPDPKGGTVELELPGNIPEAAAEKILRALSKAYRDGRVNVAEEVYDVAAAVISRGGRPSD